MKTKGGRQYDSYQMQVQGVKCVWESQTCYEGVEMKKRRPFIPLYVGEENVADSTEELAEQLGVEAKTVRFMSSPAHNKE